MLYRCNLTNFQDFFADIWISRGAKSKQSENWEAKTKVSKRAENYVFKRFPKCFKILDLISTKDNIKAMPALDETSEWISLAEFSVFLKEGEDIFLHCTRATIDDRELLYLSEVQQLSEILKNQPIIDFPEEFQDDIKVISFKIDF